MWKVPFKPAFSIRPIFGKPRFSFWQKLEFWALCLSWEFFAFSFLALDWGLKVWTPLMAIVVQARTEPSVDWLWESNRPWAGKSRRPSPIFWGPTGFHFWILFLFFIHFSTGEVSSGLFWHCGLRLLSSLWQIYWGELSLLCYFILYFVEHENLIGEHREK